MKLAALVLIAAAIATTTAFAVGRPDRTPVEFFKGHTHNGEVAINAPAHSGGTDRWGCHNGSVPYHCH